MNFEEKEFVNRNGETEKHIFITSEDGSGRSFPADPENPEYVAFEKALAEEAKTK